MTKGGSGMLSIPSTETVTPQVLDRSQLENLGHVEMSLSLFFSVRKGPIRQPTAPTIIADTIYPK